MSVLARVTAAVFALLALSLLLFAALVLLASSYEPELSSETLPDALMALVFAGVGTILTLKRPENLVGWALSLAGLGLLLGAVLYAYGELALLARPDAGLPGGAAAGAIAAGSWTPLLAGVFLLVLTFPSGRVPTRALRRWAVLVLAGLAIVWFGIATSPGVIEPPLDAYDNPLAVTQSALYLLLFVPIIAACLVSLAVAAARSVRLFRRARGQERQQFKWLAASAVFLAATLPFAAALNWAGAIGVIVTLALIALPVSVGIAVLRYRLYEIDRIISRTLVYGVLTVILGAAYAGLVLAGQAVFSSVAGGSNLAIAGSTLVVAALFLPLRSRVQGLVDRRFYRRRYDAQRTLEAFGSRLREQVELDGLCSDLEGAVRETMQPAHVSVWLREEAR
jgi:hypothetical protein